MVIFWHTFLNSVYSDESDEEDGYEMQRSVSMNSSRNSGLPREVSSVTADKAHVLLLKLSKTKGNWEDGSDVWKCIQAYNSKLTKEAVMNVSTAFFSQK